MTTSIQNKQADDLVVYTSIFGDGYSLPATFHSDSVTYICFTDQYNLEPHGWEIVHSTPILKADLVRSARELKIRPHRYLRKFKRSIYVDPSVKLIADPDDFWDFLMGGNENAVFGALLHSYRNSVLEEFDEVLKEELDTAQVLEEHLKSYVIHEPEALQLAPIWSAMLARKHLDPICIDAMELWFCQVLRYSRRDQLSLSTIIDTVPNHLKNLIKADNFNSPFHFWPIDGYARPSRYKQSIVENLIPPILNTERYKQKYLNAIAERDTAIANAKKEIQAIYASNSWKLTFPLRAITSFIRKISYIAKKIIQRLQKFSYFKRLSHNPVIIASRSLFNEDGYLGPIPLLTENQCRLILKHYKQSYPITTNAWPKDLAVKDRFFYDLAINPKLIDLLKPLIGEEFSLWGASIVEREPGQKHDFHTDIESSNVKGGFVSVWIPLENASRESSLKIITYSHQLKKSIQQEFYERNLERGMVAPETILSWVRVFYPQAKIMQPDIVNGDAILFDGRIWHGSDNSSPFKRTALLLQYVRKGIKVPIQEYGTYQWPFKLLNETAVLLPASGADHFEIKSKIFGSNQLEAVISLGDRYVTPDEAWKPYHILLGETPNLAVVESHVSVLKPRHSPHLPHCHCMEEILLVIEGEAEIVIADSENDQSPKLKRLKKGSFVYYPAYQYHTIRNISSAPVRYLMYKWQGCPRESLQPLRTSIFHTIFIFDKSQNQAIKMQTLFDGETEYLDRLHSHITQIEAGAGYDEHIDDHDVAIIVLEGEIETSGKRIGPLGSVFFPAGELHGLSNSGGTVARYIVFEFHKNTG